MKRFPFTSSTIAPLAAVVLGSACAFQSTTKRSESVEKIDDLLARVEVVQVDAVVSKEAARAALNELSTLCDPDFAGNAKDAYTAFVEKIETSEKQAKTLHLSVEPMRQTAESIFAKWTSDLSGFGSTTMRQRSQARLDDTRARYQAVYSAAQSALISFDAYNADLRDHALFLGHDLNATAVAELSGDVKELENAVSALDARLEQCSNAARLYVEASALHGQVEVAETEQPAAESAAEPSAKAATTTKGRTSTLKRRGTAAPKPAAEPAPSPSGHVTEPSPASNPPPPTPGSGTGNPRTPAPSGLAPH